MSNLEEQLDLALKFNDVIRAERDELNIKYKTLKSRELKSLISETVIAVCMTFDTVAVIVIFIFMFCSAV